MERKTHRGRTPRYDWSTVDWSTTNAEIAEFLGGRIALETVARKRVELGHPTVYPESLRDKLARAEAEVERLRAALSELVALVGHDCDEGGFSAADIGKINAARALVR